MSGKKIALMAMAVVSVASLVGCQSQPQRSGYQGQGPRHVSPEMRQKQMPMRADHFKRGQKVPKNVCEGKAVGASAQLQRRGQNIDGQCQLVFKADRDSMRAWQHAQFKQQTAHKTLPKTTEGVLSDAQRIEMTKQFEQRLIAQQSYQRAVLSACQNQTAGKTVSLNILQNTLTGQCQLQFKPNQPTA